MKIATNRGVVVGELLDGVYTKVVKGSTHKMRKPAGWSNDKDIVDNLLRLGCREIKIIDKETDTHWCIGIDDFIKEAIYINRGFGEQLVVPFKYWEVTHRAERS